MPLIIDSDSVRHDDTERHMLLREAFVALLRYDLLSLMILAESRVL